MKRWLSVALLLFAWSPAHAVDFKWQDIQGNSFSIENLQGKPALIHIWASWCPACRNELPAFAEWAANNADVNIIPVSVDRHSEDAAAFLKTSQINMALLLSDESQVRKLGVRVLPTTIIIAADGSILQTHRGAMNWGNPDLSQQLLNQLHPAE